MSFIISPWFRGMAAGGQARKRLSADRLTRVCVRMKDPPFQVAIIIASLIKCNFNVYFNQTYKLVTGLLDIRCFQKFSHAQIRIFAIKLW